MKSDTKSIVKDISYDVRIKYINLQNLKNTLKQRASLQCDADVMCALM